MQQIGDFSELIERDCSLPAFESTIVNRRKTKDLGSLVLTEI